VIEPQDERARPGTDETFGDAVTFAFGDEESGLFATARIGFSPAAGTLSALAVVFAGREPVAAVARGDIESGEVDWKAAEADGVRATIEEPLRRWSVGFDGDVGASARCTPEGHQELQEQRGRVRFGVGLDQPHDLAREPVGRLGGQRLGPLGTRERGVDDSLAGQGGLRRSFPAADRSRFRRGHSTIVTNMFVEDELGTAGRAVGSSPPGRGPVDDANEFVANLVSNKRVR